jgi:hypothetical protein
MTCKRQVWSALILLIGWNGVAVSAGAQGIPEPDLVMYGTVLNVLSNANLRLGYGTLTCVFRPSGGGAPVTASTTLSNLGNQFSYVLRIPCETPVPGYSITSNTIPLTPGGITFDRSSVNWNGNLTIYAQPAQTNTSFFATDRGRIERVDLTVSTPLLDLDGNGLPDDWERTYFGRTGLDPNSDPDGDGMNLLAEYRAGTDPTDPSSVFRITEMDTGVGGVRVAWLSSFYRSYALQRAAAASGPYRDIATGLASTPPTNSFLDTAAAGLGPYFYRVRIDDAFSIPAPLLWIQTDPQGGIRLEWMSTPGQFYTLQRSLTESSGYVNVATNIAAMPAVNTYHDAAAVGDGPYFYRLLLEP